MDLFDRLVASGMSRIDAKRALDYSEAYAGDIAKFIRYQLRRKAPSFRAGI